MKHFKPTSALSLILAAVCLSACNNTPVPPVTDEITDAATIAPVTTEAPTTTEAPITTEAPTEPVTETITEPVTEPITEPVEPSLAFNYPELAEGQTLKENRKLTDELLKSTEAAGRTVNEIEYYKKYRSSNVYRHYNCVPLYYGKGKCVGVLFNYYYLNEITGEKTEYSEFLWTMPDSYSEYVYVSFAEVNEYYPERNRIFIYYKLEDSPESGYCVDVINPFGQLIYRCREDMINGFAKESHFIADDPSDDYRFYSACLTKEGKIHPLSEVGNVDECPFEVKGSEYYLADHFLNEVFEKELEATVLTGSIFTDEYSYCINNYGSLYFYTPVQTVYGALVKLPKCETRVFTSPVIDPLRRKDEPKYTFDSRNESDINAGAEYVEITKGEPEDIKKEFGISGTRTRIVYHIHLGHKCTLELTFYTYDIPSGVLKKVSGLSEALKTELDFTLALDEPVYRNDLPSSAEEFEYELNADGTVRIKKYMGESSNVVIPDKIDGHCVTVIGQDCFREWQECTLLSVQLPSTVKVIEDRAFFGCKYLRDVLLPENVEIGKNAFNGTPLTHLHTKEDAVDLPTVSAFTGFDPKTPYGDEPSETEYTVPEQFEALHSLKNITSSVTVTVPATVKTVDCTDGEGCSIVIPASAEIKWLAGTYGTVTLGAGTKKIGDHAFENAVIDTLILPEGITEIGEFAFAYAKINNIVLPSSVKKIHAYAFLCFEGTVDIAKGGKITELSVNACVNSVASKNLKDALYMAKLTDRDLDSRIEQLPDGSYRVKGTELIIPGNGMYLNYEDDGDFRFYATENTVATGEEKRALDGGIYEKDGKFYFSFANGTEDVLLDISYPTGDDVSDVTASCVTNYVSDSYGYGRVTFKYKARYGSEGDYYYVTETDSYTAIIRNGGKTQNYINTGSYGDLIMLDEYVGIVRSGVIPAAGSRQVYVKVTLDGGRTFSSESYSSIISTYIFGGSVLRENIMYPYYVTGYRYCGPAFASFIGFDYLTPIYTDNYALLSAVERTGYTVSYSEGKAYFDGDTGMYRLACTVTDDKGEKQTYYVHLLSFDNGQSWEVFDPCLYAEAEARAIPVAKQTVVDENVTYVETKGVIKIEGSDKIIMPEVAVYQAIDAMQFDKIEIDTNDEVPAYKGVLDSAHRFYRSNGTLYCSYDNGRVISPVQENFTAADGTEIKLDLTLSNLFNYYLSRKLSWFYNAKTLVYSTDMFRTVNSYTFPDEIDNVTWLSDTEVYVVCMSGKRFAEGTEHTAYRSVDGGKTFVKQSTVERANSYGLVINGKEYRVPLINEQGNYGTQMICADKEMLVDGNEAVLPKIMKESEYFKYSGGATMPYFDGNVGIWLYGSYPYYILVTVDGGLTWQLYNNRLLAYVDYNSWVYKTGK